MNYGIRRQISTGCFVFIVYSHISFYKVCRVITMFQT